MVTLQKPMVDLVSMCESCHNSVYEKSQIPIPAFLGINAFEGGCDSRNAFAKKQAEADRQIGIQQGFEKRVRTSG